MKLVRGMAAAAAWMLLILPSAAMAKDAATPEKAGSVEANAREFEEFDPAKFSRSTKIDHPYWPLVPGTKLVYEGTTLDDEDRTVPHRLDIVVTDLVKVIGGVKSVVVYEADYSSGSLQECELAFFAQDDEGSVWHLGQYSEVYDEVEFVGGRAFLVGHLDGARAGIMVPAKPQTGTPSYSQGYGPPPYNWTDRGRIYQLGQKVKIAMGSYDDVLVTEEFSRKEPGASQLKYYAKGVGYVKVGWKGKDPKQETLELTKVETLSVDGLAKYRNEALTLEKRAYVYGSTKPAEQAPRSEASGSLESKGK